MKEVIISCHVFHKCRSRLQRTSQNIDDADEERENDLVDVAIGQELRGSCHFSEVVGVYTRNLAL